MGHRKRDAKGLTRGVFGANVRFMFTPPPARGTGLQPTPRFDRLARVTEADGWDIPEEAVPVLREIAVERPRSAISRNAAPDLPFDRSVNAYRGCEHGCIFCYARPTHA